jgi:AcrR family transcriptional regulator
MSPTRTYTKVARAAAQEQTRTALLDAAGEAFFEGDWDSVSLDAIAAGAGTTKQTLLRHFGSKDGLLEAAFMRGMDEVRAQRLAAPAGDVEGAIDNLLEHYAEHGSRALKIGALAGGGRVGLLVQRARELHYEWVEHAFGAWLRGTRGQRRERLRAALIVACDVQAWWILAHDLQLGPREVRATLVLTVTRLLGEEA